MQSFIMSVIPSAVVVNQFESSIIICPIISGVSSFILYPSPCLFLCTYSNQKFINRTHFNGPPTDPCLTPLLLLYSPSLPRMSCVDLPGASDTAVCPPLSISIIISTMSCGVPIALQDIACDQYSRVSNALVRSAENM